VSEVLALSAVETAALLQVSRQTVLRLVADGHLAKLPGLTWTRIPRESVDAYLATKADAPEREDELAAKRKLAEARAAFEASLGPKGRKATRGTGHANRSTHNKRAAAATN
jgi:excisionase family DNA binding protein